MTEISNQWSCYTTFVDLLHDARDMHPKASAVTLNIKPHRISFARAMYRPPVRIVGDATLPNSNYIKFFVKVDIIKSHINVIKV